MVVDAAFVPLHVVTIVDVVMQDVEPCASAVAAQETASVVPGVALHSELSGSAGSGSAGSGFARLGFGWLGPGIVGTGMDGGTITGGT